MDGIFKFIDKSPSVQPKLTKRCFPTKLYGVSQESPVEFKLSNTLVNLDGYIWKQPSIHYLSQLRHHSIVGKSHLSTTFANQHKKRLEIDESSFRRRKGLLSEFLDNHAWKKKVIPLLGAERNKEGRSLRNIELDKLRKQTSQKHSSLNHIRHQYSLVNRRDISLQEQQNRYSLDQFMVHKASETDFSKTIKLTPLEVFQRHITKVPESNQLNDNQKHARQSFSIDKLRKSYCSSFRNSNKFNNISTHEDSMRRSYITKRNPLLNRSNAKEFKDSKQLRRSKQIDYWKNS